MKDFIGARKIHKEEKKDEGRGHESASNITRASCSSLTSTKAKYNRERLCIGLAFLSGSVPLILRTGGNRQ